MASSPSSTKAEMQIGNPAVEIDPTIGLLKDQRGFVAGGIPSSEIIPSHTTYESDNTFDINGANKVLTNDDRDEIFANNYNAPSRILGANNDNIVATAGMPSPDWEPNDDWEPDDPNRDEWRWKKKDSGDAPEAYRNPKFGRINKDPIQKWDGKPIWYSRDTAGHAGGKFKLFIKQKTKFIRVGVVDETGRLIPRHQGKVGKYIKIKDLWKIK